jgi:hypothetical protein
MLLTLAITAHAQGPAASCPSVAIIFMPDQTQINATVATDNKYGCEDGTVVRDADGVFHLVTAEMYTDPFWVAMRLGAWTSSDGYTWSRNCTLRQSSAVVNGSDPRAAMWGPMYIYDDAVSAWALLYVGYRSSPSNSSGWLGNYDGRLVVDAA